MLRRLGGQSPQHGEHVGTWAWMFAPELESDAVQRVLTEWSLPSLDLWAVYPTGRMPSAKARAFAAFVEAALTGTQAGLPDH